MTGRKTERYLFSVTMWVVVLISLSAIGVKAVLGRLASVPVHYLLGFAVVASLLAIIIPNLEQWVFSRLSKISLGGVELHLNHAAGEADPLLREEKPEDVALGYSTVDSAYAYPTDHPFPVSELTGPQRYSYERYSHKLYQLFDQVEDPNKLDSRTLERYRWLIKYVGEAAYAMKHYSKSLDVVTRLETLKDRPLSAAEMLLIGSAYLWAADELPTEAQRRDHWKKAQAVLEAAMQQNSRDERTVYNLGWVCLALGQYRHGVRLMRASIRLRGSLAPWAKWNIACGRKKLGKSSQALEALQEIPPGPWWHYIEQDDWFVDNEDTAFMASFKALCAEKKKLWVGRS